MGPQLAELMLATHTSRNMFLCALVCAPDNPTAAMPVDSNRPPPQPCLQARGKRKPVILIGPKAENGRCLVIGYEATQRMRVSGLVGRRAEEGRLSSVPSGDCCKWRLPVHHQMAI